MTVLCYHVYISSLVVQEITHPVQESELGSTTYHGYRQSLCVSGILEPYRYHSYMPSTTIDQQAMGFDGKALQL